MADTKRNKEKNNCLEFGSMGITQILTNCEERVKINSIKTWGDLVFSPV